MLGHCTSYKALTLAALLSVLPMAELVAEPDYSIDLNALPVYVRSGFQPETIPTADQPVDDSFLTMAPRESRPIIIQDLPLPAVPKRRFPELRTLPAGDFTILWRFSLSDDDLSHMNNPVLLLAQIGEGWEIVLNGHPLQRNMRDYPVNRRLQRVSINPRFLVVGVNQIIVSITGDPLSRETGLYYGSPYRIEEGAAAEAAVGQTLYIVLITFYSSIGLFHLLFFLGDRKRFYNLYFGFFAMTLAAYLFSRSSLSYAVIENATALFRIEMSSLALGLPAFIYFSISILGRRSRPFFHFGALVAFHGITISGLTLVFPANGLYDLLVVWQFTTPPLLLVLEGFLLTFFFKDLRQLVRANGLLQGSYRALFSRVPGNLVIGTLFVMTTSVYDIYAAFVMHTSPGISSYGLLLFITGSAMRIAYNLLLLLQTNLRLNRSLRSNFLNLRRLHRTLIRSEEKYRRLIEETNDIVFTLDRLGTVTAANSSLYRELGIRPDDLVGRPFIQILQKETIGEAAFSQSFTVDRVVEFIDSGDALNIRVPLFAEKKKGHVFFDLKFEKIRSREETDIIVKASAVEEDPALKFLVRETIAFEMSNDLFVIEDMVRRLIVDLPRFLDEYEISMIRIGLREIIVNAIEHGNLGITFLEKTDLLNAGNYQDEIRNRLTREDNNGRSVRIRLTLTPSQIRYRITDEGKGFDHRRFGFHIDPEQAGASLHGRGIFITRNAFTRVIYNESGNSVLLVRDLPDLSNADRA